MKRLRKQHVLEQSIYGAIWIVIFLLPLIGGYFAMSGGLEREETRMVIRESWLSILPFFVLFLLNNYGLVPYFLFKKRYWQYTVSLIFVIGMICWLSPFPSANHFPKDFKRGELPLRMKENRRVSLEPFYKISQNIKYHVISYLSLSFINLNIS